MLDAFFTFLNSSNFISLFVLVSLLVYLFVVFWIFTYKYKMINELLSSEDNELKNLVNNGGFNHLSLLGQYISNQDASYEILETIRIKIIKYASKNISWLSIIASTAPFIGLFGTVIGILESFAQFENEAKVSFGTIAPAISQALVATAAGIFVAIFAYTFHQLISRKIYELDMVLSSQIMILSPKSQKY